MNIAREFVLDAAVGVGIATTPRGLSIIQQPGCAAAIWKRQPLSGFQTWIDGLVPDHLPRARIVLRPELVRRALSEIVPILEPQACPEWTMLVDDIAAMADVFAGVMRAPFLRLRLDVITTNACRRFHTDAVTARLVCTYRGTGTQYGISPDGSEPSHVLTVPTGSPMVMRGTLWPETPRSGLRHRSPPIEGTGETRLVLVLDPILDLDDEDEVRLVH